MHLPIETSSWRRRSPWIAGTAVVVIAVLFANGCGVLGAVGVAAAFAVTALVVTRRRSAGTSAPAGESFAELVALCYGEREVAERLVVAQAKRAPVSSHRQHVWAAIDRLREDRRR